MSRGWLLQRSPRTLRNENKWADAGMNNPLLHPLARGASALWNWGHGIRGPIATYVAYLWFPWQCEDPPIPHNCQHHTCIPSSHYPPTPPVSHPFAHSVDAAQTLPTPRNVKIFLKCQLISAALECLHKLNMFINTFFFFPCWRNFKR